MTGRTWERLVLELAARLPRLDSGDTVRLSYGCYFTMLQQAPDFLRMEAMSNHTAPRQGQLSTEQEHQLRVMGWEPPDPPGDQNWWVHHDWPLSGRTATRLAEMMVRTLRDVHRIDGTAADVEEEVFNAFGGPEPWGIGETARA